MLVTFVLYPKLKHTPIHTLIHTDRLNELTKWTGTLELQASNTSFITFIHALTLMLICKYVDKVNCFTIQAHVVVVIVPSFCLRQLCPVEPENRVPPERNLRSPHYHHGLWKPADGQHFTSASEGVPVRSPWRLCGHGAHHGCRFGYRSHYCHPYLHHHPAGWVIPCHVYKTLYV